MSGQETIVFAVFARRRRWSAGFSFQPSTQDELSDLSAVARRAKAEATPIIGRKRWVSLRSFGHAAVRHNKANNRSRIPIKEYRNNWTAIRNHGNCVVMINGSTHTLLLSTID